MDTIISMKVFVKTAELGSFAAAANVMHLSAQMVAKHIAYLEYRLGTTLIERTTRKHNLTHIGQQYYHRSKQILNDIDEAEQCAQQLQQKPKGRLKISAPISLGSSCITVFSQKFMQIYPEIDIELQLSDRYVSAEDGFDIIIRIGEIQDHNLIATPLRPYSLIACAAPAYLDKMGLPLTPLNLQQHHCLIYDGSGYDQRAELWQFIQGKNTIQVKVHGRFRSNNWHALLTAALAGMGIVIGPAEHLQALIDQGQLIQILKDYQAPERPMQILYPANRKPTAKILSFVSAFVAQFGDAKD